MPSRHKSSIRTEVIRCKNCGEDYSVTYKRCPFCDESAARNASGRGGKRLSNARGGGYGGGWGPLRLITTVLSIALIIAAVYIVITIVKPLIDRGSGQPGTTVTVSPGVTATPALEPSAAPTGEPATEPTQQVTDPTPPPIPSVQAAERFTLSVSDFTLSRAGETYPIRATFSPSGTSGTIAWTSSNPTSVHVAADGTVTGLAKGNSTITATMTGGLTQTCIVRCGWSDGSTAPTPGTGATTAIPASNTGLAINRSDITLKSAGETFTLKVTGTSSTPTWSSSNSSVAEVSSGGKITAVKSGTVTVTATVDGQTFKCIIRCNF